jgi:hypothetical protein
VLRRGGSAIQLLARCPVDHQLVAAVPLVKAFAPTGWLERESNQMFPQAGMGRAEGIRTLTGWILNRLQSAAPACDQGKRGLKRVEPRQQRRQLPLVRTRTRTQRSVALCGGARWRLQHEVLMALRSACMDMRSVEISAWSCSCGPPDAGTSLNVHPLMLMSTHLPLRRDRV